MQAARRLSGERILVVEDDEASRRALELRLQFEGAQVSVAGNAGDAREQLRDLQPTVAIVDLGLPSEDEGIGLCRELRSQPDQPRLPIVILTARDLDDRIRDLIHTGLVFYVRKGTAIAPLVNTIRNGALQGRRERERHSTEVVLG